jgi:hypothetical protein
MGLNSLDFVVPDALLGNLLAASEDGDGCALACDEVQSPQILCV